MRKGKINVKKEEFDIIINDAMNLVKRYYWVFCNFSDSKGNKTGILYGVMNFTESLKKKYKGAKIIYAWDSKPTKKKEMSGGEYKANRKHEKLDDLWQQVTELKIMLSYYNIDQYYCEGYEADDIVSKIVRENKGKKILLVSKDHDWFQLLNDDVKIFMDNKVYNKEEIEDEFEINIENYTLFKTIVGDNGDNVKGIPRIKKKEVWELVDGCDTIEDVIDKARSERNSFGRLIVDNEEKIMKNYKLIKMIDKNYKIQKIDKIDSKERLIEHLRSHDMNKLIERISNG